MTTRPRYWLIVSLTLVLAAAPAFALGSSGPQAAMTMDEHCPDCAADVGGSEDACGVANCPAPGMHCAAAAAPLAPCSDVRLSAFALAYVQMHSLLLDQLISRLEFCIFRPPIG